MRQILLILITLLTFSLSTEAQIGQKSRKQEKRDSLENVDNKNKEIPKGIRVWTVDRRFGDIRKALVDTVSHMYPNTVFTSGLRGEYNFTGSLGSPRINRIATDRKTYDGDFLFMQPYSYFISTPDEWLFTNTLSPYVNISYNKGGGSTTGEDHITAKFSVNAGKRLGFGFKVDYLYHKGFYQNQNTSLFNFSLFGSYIGDRYNAHLILGRNALKMAESGGLTNDYYITHPEIYQESYASDEMPVLLSQNWNRASSWQAFLTHRYSLGFHRKARMTDEEIEAKKFAWESKKDQAKRDSTGTEGQAKELTDSDFIKSEFVPVTSFIHTMELGSYQRIYQSYKTPDQLYAQDFYEGIMGTDSIFDKTSHFRLRNTLAVSMLEGFNRWMVAGIKLFAASDLKTYTQPDENYVMQRYTKHALSLGGQLVSTQHKHLHYNVTAETWVMGDELGQVKIDGGVDLNFPLFKDTVTLAAKGFFHNERLDYYMRHYHSRHFWWDDNLNMQQQIHLEGLFSYQKTKTTLRFAADMFTNYTYLGDTYSVKSNGDRLTNWNVTVNQSPTPVTLLTASLTQNFRLGILNWENVITWQHSTNQSVLPVPALNIYSNLYLKFRIAHVLNTEFGVDGRYFTSYEAPDYVPGVGQFAVQQNEEKVKIGNYPIANVYVNFLLKGTRFFVMYTHITKGMGNKMQFLTPHYPIGGSVLRLGLSWNFWN